MKFRSGGTILQAEVPSDSIWTAVKDVLIFEEYELLPEFGLGHLEKGSVVVDAGSFVGLYSLKASAFASEVVAVEPSLRNFEILKANVHKSGRGNISPIRKAIWSDEGSVQFVDAGTTSAVAPEGARDGYRVPTSSLAGLLAGFPRVDLLKMDIEGAEFEVLLGTDHSVLRKIRMLAAEIHLHPGEDRSRLPALLSHLRRSGMEVRVVPNVYGSMRYVLAKPWICPLKSLNGGRGTLLRAYLSAAYSIAHFFPRLVSFWDKSTVVLLFARRNNLDTDEP